ncbi:hypothetical protein JCM10207_008261 [Rhodosporidiobolus poonsookiae]
MPPHSTLGSTAFRDPSLDISAPSSLRSPLSSSYGSTPSPTSTSPGRPSLPSRPSELARELAAAADDDLPAPAATPPEMSRKASERKSGGSPSLMEQFRNGSGWFAPVVPAEAPLTREERAAREKARIDKLKDGRESKTSRRPGLIKRMSSGVELFGYGGSGSAASA